MLFNSLFSLIFLLFVYYLMAGSVPGFPSSETRVSGNLRWTDMLGISKVESVHEPLVYDPPGLVEGVKLIVFSEAEVAADAHRC